MTVLTNHPKDPDAVLDYRWDWSVWLKTGETISTVTWDVPAGITQQSHSDDTSSATIWLTGGTVGKNYLVTCRIVTSSGRTDDRSQLIPVRQR